MRKSWRLHSRSGTLVIVHRSDLKKDETPVHPHNLITNLDRWLTDPLTKKSILDIYEDVGGSTGNSRQATKNNLIRYVKPRLEKAFQRGDLVAIQPSPAISLKGLKVLEETKSTRIVSPTRQTERHKAWLRFQIVEDKTGKPVKGLKLKVTLPDGSETTKETQADGIVDVTDVNPGVYSITSAVMPVEMSKTFNYSGMGERWASTDKSEEKENLEKFIDGANMSIAVFEAHKVKTGETLDSIAQSYGYSADDMARFNWGTSDPKEINNHLRDNVGCAKKTTDGQNYELNISDEPGIIYIPKQWKQTGLTTERTHTIRVKLKGIFLVILENALQLRIPEVRYEATLADGSKRSGRLGRSGVSLIEDPPPGPVEVEFPDLDDIEAKSLAACVRKSFDDRNTEDIFRLLGHSPQMIKMVISTYEEYYNDYTGKGMVEDIYQEITDPVALMAVEGLLARAGVPTHGEVHYMAWKG